MAKRKDGEPRSDKIELTPAQIKQLETMAGLGLKTGQMAAILGISERTLERRASEGGNVADAISKGRAAATFNVTKTAYEMALSGKVPAMTIFWLKCRANWKDVQHVEAKATVENKPGPAKITAKDLEAIRAKDPLMIEDSNNESGSS